MFKMQSDPNIENEAKIQFDSNTQYIQKPLWYKTPKFNLIQNPNNQIDPTKKNYFDSKIQFDSNTH